MKQKVTGDVKTLKLTFSNHRHAYGHAHELAFSPNVGVDAYPAFLTLAVKSGDGGVMGHLFGNKA